MSSTTFSGPVTSTNGFIGDITGATQTTMTAGTGITTGVGTVANSNVIQIGGLIYTTVLMDLTGLNSSTSDLDVIGVDGTALVCHWGQITTAVNGTLIGGTLACYETPAGGVTDIDFYSATVGTAVESDGIAALDEQALYAKGSAAAGAVATKTALTNLPRANDYLYVVTGTTGTAAKYTAGIFVLELVGIPA